MYNEYLDNDYDYLVHECYKSKKVTKFKVKKKNKKMENVLF